MFKTIGFIVDNLYNNQLSNEICKELNILAQKSNYNVVVFTKNILPVNSALKFGVFGLSYIHGVSDGVLIATDLDSAEILIRSQTTAKKIFYVWNLEWMNINKRNYLHNISIYNNIELVTRSKSYADAIGNYSNSYPLIKTLKDVIDENQ